MQNKIVRYHLHLNKRSLLKKYVYFVYPQIVLCFNWKFAKKKLRADKKQRMWNHTGNVVTGEYQNIQYYVKGCGEVMEGKQTTTTQSSPYYWEG